MSFLSQLFGTSDQRTTVDTPLELVNYAASLASNPGAIDSILDTVRVITSNLKPGQLPSAEQESSLFGVYLQLERYLETKEPLRTFPHEELRKRLTSSLLERLQAFEKSQPQSEKGMIH